MHNLPDYNSIVKPVDCSCGGGTPKVKSKYGYMWVLCTHCGFMSCTTPISEEEKDVQRKLDAVSLWNSGVKKPSSKNTEDGIFVKKKEDWERTQPWMEGELRRLKVRLSVVEPNLRKSEEANEKLKNQVGDLEKQLQEKVSIIKSVRTANHNPDVLKWLESALDYVNEEDYDYSEIVFSLTDVGRALVHLDPEHKNTDDFLLDYFYHLIGALVASSGFDRLMYKRYLQEWIEDLKKED